ncbi:hypothetical protein [Methylomonas koyamae]|uniref:hypothetical protein n=1 Tax=Methylomonas koyamae TaxID=702114 RepID=UPI002872D1EE|nr:hypothetical protein [Methylomonas koyamae]WNB74450.1 hypothetical protein RI210_14295 [Methylomonas koyamae]
MTKASLILKLQDVLTKYSGDIPRSEILNIVGTDSNPGLHSMNCFWCGEKILFKWPIYSICQIKCPVCKKSSKAYFGAVKAKRFKTTKIYHPYPSYFTIGTYTIRSFDNSGDERQIDFSIYGAKNIELRAKDVFCLITSENMPNRKNLKFRGEPYPEHGMIIITNFTVSKSHPLRLFNKSEEILSLFSHPQESLTVQQ